MWLIIPTPDREGLCSAISSVRFRYIRWNIALAGNFVAGPDEPEVTPPELTIVQAEPSNTESGI
jgi:hypothetical protein